MKKKISSYTIEPLALEEYHKCSSIWNMKTQPLTETWREKIVSGNRLVFIYKVKGKFIGEGALVLDTGDPDYTIPGKRVYVSRMIVKKEYRNQGIGSTILAFLIEKAKEIGFEEMTIGVDKDNANALHLYRKFGFTEGLFDGADFLGGIISGDFGIDGNSIVRFLADTAYFDNNFNVSPVITTTIELLSNTGVLDKLTDVARRELYAEIEYGIISALATATFLTMPCYWALVSTEDFDTALTYVFGEEGSEKRIQYAGLIKKITDYNNTIKANTEEILKITQASGTNMCVISKYGVQMLPVLKDGSILGDQYVSVVNSSFGATTSDIYGTLDEDYIAERVALGYGNYISPDKQIDTSTCLFPEYTWFVKGCSHGFYSTPERDLILTTIDADRQLTVDDFPYTRFVKYDYEENTFNVMTEENCNIGSWEADDKIENSQTKKEQTVSLLVSLMRWLTTIFNAIRSLFS